MYGRNIMCKTRGPHNVPEVIANSAPTLMQINILCIIHNRLGGFTMSDMITFSRPNFFLQKNHTILWVILQIINT